MFLKARRSSRARTAAAGLAAVALLATACGGSSSSGDANKDTLVVYTGQSGDWQLNFNPYSPTMLEGPGTIFEPLFFFNNIRDVEPRPRLGKSFKWNADGTQLDVELRDDAKWSDGQEFTAEDVVFTLDMVSKNATMNSTGYKGVATAVDDTHVTIKFTEPSFMDGPQVLGRIWMVPQHKWKDIATPATDVVKEPVGTGPFMLDEFKAQAFTLKSNPAYHSGEPALKKIRYLALSGNQSGEAALKQGQIDWQTGPVPDIANVEKNYPGYKAITIPMNQVALFTCSNAALGCQGPQTDVAVRKAIYYAVNRTQINSLAFENTASEVSPGAALLERDKDQISGELQEKTAPMQPDEAKATQLLESAGYAKGGDGIYAKDGKPLAMTLKVVAGWTDYITAVDTMSQQLQKVGIKVTAQQVSWNEWSDARGRGNFELLIDSLHQGPAPDPFYNASYFFSTATTAKVGETANPNFSRFSNPAVDAALAALKGIDPEDDAARQPHFDTIQTEIEKSLPYIPVLTGGTTSEYNAKKFTGWPTKDDLYSFPAVWARPEHSEIYLKLKPAGQ
ncbi:peptide/nickel transport system substrate-binding protein [Saccharothrix saharensis]|uniref:Peptide/nickel transport system substrate-binding protein n=1 Tax=Saccharothrix saharensis TaxID=571190 RepID=A0A543JJH2_9PSEU|nr:ABC transporter substrate-binding protein [Saccharothrix saharensis]TQM82986.1 peptide/nickel transport system substrate-binding protein [Saccharothrix saharensis]